MLSISYTLIHYIMVQQTSKIIWGTESFEVVSVDYCKLHLHTEDFFLNLLNLDCNYTFPNDLAPIRIPFDSDFIGKMYLYSNFGLF